MISKVLSFLGSSGEPNDTYVFWNLAFLLPALCRGIVDVELALKFCSVSVETAGVILMPSFIKPSLKSC